MCLRVSACVCVFVCVWYGVCSGMLLRVPGECRSDNSVPSSAKAEVAHEQQEELNEFRSFACVCPSCTCRGSVLGVSVYGSVGE